VDGACVSDNFDDDGKTESSWGGTVTIAEEAIEVAVADNDNRRLVSQGNPSVEPKKG